MTFLAPNFECFTNDAFCSHSFGCACFRRLRLIVVKVQNYGKIVFIQNIFENGWWGGCIRSIPHIPLVV